MDVGSPDRHRPAQPYVPELRILRIEDIDFAKLRSGRLARLQAKMREQDMPVALFYHPANIRYATGTDVMGVWTTTTFARYAVVPADGAPVLFEYAQWAHRSREVVKDVRPARDWQMQGAASAGLARAWADEIAALLAELGLRGERLAVDRLDPFGFHALGDAGIEVIDAGPATVAARDIKTPEEVALFKVNGAIGDVMLAEFEAAIRPGIREYELLAVLSHTLLAHHGEILFTRMVGSGPNTNPWNAEAHDRRVQVGDLVAVDTDANGYEGYVIDVSRTFLCGDEALPGQREAYRVAYDCVMGTIDVMRAGMTYEEVSRAAPEIPDAYKAGRYVSMAHTAGLEDESPGIPYLYGDRDPPARAPDKVIEENMIWCVECYAGREGAPYGVKLEDQVLITADGPKRICTYPFEAKLL